MRTIRNAKKHTTHHPITMHGDQQSPTQHGLMSNTQGTRIPTYKWETYMLRIHMLKRIRMPTRQQTHTPTHNKQANIHTHHPTYAGLLHTMLRMHMLKNMWMPPMNPSCTPAQRQRAQGIPPSYGPTTNLQQSKLQITLKYQSHQHNSPRKPCTLVSEAQTTQLPSTQFHPLPTLLPVKALQC
jgi:hypothetical protein